MAEAINDENEIQALEIEIDRAKKLRRALVKLKHRLETKLRIPCSATFVEYENFAKVTQPKNNYLAVAIASSRVNRDLSLIAGGIKCIDGGKGLMHFELCFGVGPRAYSGFRVQINHVENEGFRLVKYYLPEGLNVEKIIEKVPMNDFPDVIQFLKFIRGCGCAMLHRKEQVKELSKYCADKELDIDVFSSCDATYIEISFQSAILMLTSKPEMMSFVLKYDIDTCRPIDATFEKKQINQKDEFHLFGYITDFQNYSLVEALRCVRHVKHQYPESSPKQSNEGALKSIVINESVESKWQNKASRRKFMSSKKEFAASQRIREQSTLESRSKSTTSKHSLIHRQQMSEEDVEFSPKSSPRRISNRAPKNPEEEVESGSERTSPRCIPTRAQKLPAEDVESSPKSSPRRIPTRAKKMLEEDVESRPNSASTTRISFHSKKTSDDSVESIPMFALPRRIPNNAQKMLEGEEEDVESSPNSASTTRISFHSKKTSDDSVESIPMFALPRRIPNNAQKMLEEDVESRPNSTSPTRSSLRAQKIPEDDESMLKSTSLKQTPARAQKMPAKKVAVFRPITWFPEHPEYTRDHSKRKDPKEKPYFFQKSSTPLRMFTADQQEKLPSDLEIDDLSTITGSDTNVQNLPLESQNVDPVASSTPFVQHNMRKQKQTFTVEEKLKSDLQKQMSPQIRLDKYHQTQIHQFIKREGDQQEERNKSIRTSLRKKKNSEQQDDFEEDDDEGEHRVKEKKRISAGNVHKGTPVPKGFRSSRVKKTVIRQSVVSGKRFKKNVN